MTAKFWLAAFCCAGVLSSIVDASEDELYEPESRPIPAMIGCEGVFRESAPNKAALFRSCTPVPFTLTECKLPSGHQFCLNGHWTILCRDDTPCPDNTRCTWGEGVGSLPDSESLGWCARTCKVPREGTCGRSDLSCNTQLGVCLASEGDSMEAEDAPCMRGRPGLTVRIDFDKPECEVRDDTLLLDVAGRTFRTSNASASTERIYRIAWPENIRRGAQATIKYDATGESRVASGTARVVTDPRECIGVTVKAHCQETIRDEPKAEEAP